MSTLSPRCDSLTLTPNPAGRRRVRARRDSRSFFRARPDPPGASEAPPPQNTKHQPPAAPRETLSSSRIVLCLISPCTGGPVRAQGRPRRRACRCRDPAESGSGEARSTFSLLLLLQACVIVPLTPLLTISLSPQLRSASGKALVRLLRAASAARDAGNKAFQAGSHQEADSAYSECAPPLLPASAFRSASAPTLRRVRAGCMPR